MRNEQDEHLDVLAILKAALQIRIQVSYVVPHSSRERASPGGGRSASDLRRGEGLELDGAGSELGPPEVKLRDTDEKDSTRPESTKY